MIDLKIDTSKLPNIEELHKNLPKVISNALNRAMSMVKTEMVKKTREVYSIERNEVSSPLKLKKSTSGTLSAEINSIGSPIGLDHFKLTPKRRMKNKKEVRVEVKNTGKKLIESAFIPYYDGKLGAFTRTSNRAYPIRRLMGPSAPQMVGNSEVIDYLSGYFEEKFDMRLEHEIERLLK